MKTFLILIFASLACGVKIDNFISGGRVATPHEFPFAVAIQARTTTGTLRTRTCGGSLISRQAILTAALCVHQHVDVVVTLGAHVLGNLTEPFQVPIAVSDIRVHPDYIDGTLTSDLAVIRLPNPIGFFNQAVQIIALPPNPDESFLNAASVTMGWGCTIAVNPALCLPTNILTTIQVFVQPDTGCGALPTIQMCGISSILQSGATCAGDEGGPLATTINNQFVQIGVVHNFPGATCAGSMTFTRINSQFLAWIREQM